MVCYNVLLHFFFLFALYSPASIRCSSSQFGTYMEFFIFSLMIFRFISSIARCCFQLLGLTLFGLFIAKICFIGFQPFFIIVCYPVVRENPIGGSFLIAIRTEHLPHSFQFSAHFFYISLFHKPI